MKQNTEVPDSNETEADRQAKIKQLDASYNKDEERWLESYTKQNSETLRKRALEHQINHIDKVMRSVGDGVPYPFSPGFNGTLP